MKWWKRRDIVEKGSITILTVVFIVLSLSVGLLFMTMSNIPKASYQNNTTPTTTVNTSEPSEKTAEPTTPNVNAEDKYRQWVKEDYQRFVKAKDSSEMYSLYQGAQSVSPPEKYKEFHQHYIQSYYYWYKAYEAGDNGDTASYEYYLNMANQEDTKLSELMPDYLQLTQG